MTAYSSGGSNAVIQYRYDPTGNRTNRTVYGASDTTDSDSDTIKDVDELYHFGDLNEDMGTDPDADGLNNSEEFALSGDPANPDTDADGFTDGEEAVAGTALNDGASVFQVVRVETAPGGEARIRWDAKNGRSYQLQMRPRLGAGDWSDAGSRHDATSDGPHYADQAYDTNAFFRVKVWMTP